MANMQTSKTKSQTSKTKLLQKLSCLGKERLQKTSMLERGVLERGEVAQDFRLEIVEFANTSMLEKGERVLSPS